MLAIICFDLIPESLEVSNIIICLLGIIIGLLIMFTCDNEIKRKYGLKNNKNSILKMGIIIGIGLAIHNFPEGLAIGSGFEVSPSLGVALALAIAIHDIPEGISMALPMKTGGISTSKVIFYTFLSGVTTGIGAGIGKLIGEISPDLIGISLGFAAGAMLYIVSIELIPESKKIYNGRFASLGNIVGIIIGMIVSRM